MITMRRRGQAPVRRPGSGSIGVIFAVAWLPSRGAKAGILSHSRHDDHQHKEPAMAASDLQKRWGLIMGLRGLVMLLAGLYAVIWPGTALLVLVMVGAAVLLVDGLLGLWALTFGGAKTGNFWFDVVRNVLAIIVGVLVLLSPVLSTLLTVWFFVYLVALQAIIVGVMEIVIAIRERAHYAKIWPILLSGVLYVLFGIVLLFEPLMGAIFFTVFAGVMMILFSIGLFALAWRLYRGGNASA
jgi:uncharacterized membrane protein HdeD (DUF308 family)